MTLKAPDTETEIVLFHDTEDTGTETNVVFWLTPDTETDRNVVFCHDTRCRDRHGILS